jgi:hypothetical protein
MNEIKIITIDGDPETIIIQDVGAALVWSVNGQIGNVVLTKDDIGLGNVDNTSDLDKPISTATQTALDGKFAIPTGLTTDYLDGTGAPQPFPDVVTQDQFNEYNLLQKEPTGFPNRTDSITSFDNSTRTFTIEPVAISFEFYVKGKKYVKSSAQNLTIPDLSGNHYIYFNYDGDLLSTQVAGQELFQENALVAIVYWNEETQTQVYFAEERHGLVMDGATHGYLHTVFGARYLSGFALQGFTVDGTGNLDAHAQFESDSGTIRDEDLIIQSLSQNEIPILYRQGSLWRRKAGDSFPVIYSGTEGYTGSHLRLPYNALSGSSWSLSEVPNNNFVLVHFFATNDKASSVIGIQGINTYTSISNARTGATEEISSLSGLPFAEFVAIGTVVFETANGYANAVKARVRSIDVGVEYVDFRGTQAFSASASVGSHSLLSNLSSDDHLQYFNQERGDARYYTKPEIDAFIDAIGLPRTDVITITSTHIVEKKFSLTTAPKSSYSIRFLPDGGIEQRFQVDYDIVANDIVWDGLELDGFLEIGDVIRVSYWA